jgi:ParB family chromosome partitioning protein
MARRLFAQLDSTPGEELEGARLLPLDRIDPNPAQSRQVFDEAALRELADSIRAHHTPERHGVLQAILVRPVGSRYQVIAGERRTRAARLAGLADIPALIQEMTDEEAAFATATENLQREDLDPEDAARWFAYLQQLTGLSDRALAERLGKHRSYVNNRLRLLRRRPDLFAAIRTGELTLEGALTVLGQEVSQVETLPTAASNGEVSQAETLTRDDSSEDAVSQPETRVERATLDHRTGAATGGDLRRTPWRARPLRGFMEWVARVDVTTVPPAERTTARQQIAEAREWLARLEMQLEELGGGKAG